MDGGEDPDCCGRTELGLLLSAAVSILSRLSQIPSLAQAVLEPLPAQLPQAWATAQAGAAGPEVFRFLSAFFFCSGGHIRSSAYTQPAADALSLP